ncbi:type II toxin-antitoxin system HicA family toxin [Hymenobacter terricola]|uniref:type II toxin-antitoxin system HicA family toxin n=1 Tax=Hymenobacter terricola TaxID=2819236 RepID=UPI00293D8C12|nr:type II toxin-antitoxin system HicA family toxin [Hymenobacter terricola]
MNFCTKLLTKATTELIKLLEKDGWVNVRDGKHKVFAHPTKQTLSGRPLVVSHGKQEIKPGTLNSILKDAGLK